MNEKDIFYPLKGYEERYLINKYGDIISLNYNKTKQKKFLTPNINSSGYYTVTICKNGKSRSHFVHRLVAENFVEKQDDNYNVVNHIDGNRSNNYYKNLEWCTQKQNCNFEIAKQRSKIACKKGHLYQQRKVYQYDLNYNLIKEWDCISDVCRDGFYSKCMIMAHMDLKYGIKTHKYKGYIWLDHKIDN